MAITEEALRVDGGVSKAHKDDRLSAVICRRAGEITAELEELPLETHQAIVSTMATLFQHRGMREQRRLQEKPTLVS